MSENACDICLLIVITLLYTVEMFTGMLLNSNILIIMKYKENIKKFEKTKAYSMLLYNVRTASTVVCKFG